MVYNIKINIILIKEIKKLGYVITKTTEHEKKITTATTMTTNIRIILL